MSEGEKRHSVAIIAAVREAIIGRPEVTNSHFALPETPGLGVDLNEAVIAAHPPMEGFMDFWKKGWEKRDSYR